MPYAAVLFLLFCLSIFDHINPLLQRIALIFYISNQRRANDISLAVHNICGGVTIKLRNKFLIKIMLWIGRNVGVSHALFF